MSMDIFDHLLGEEYNKDREKIREDLYRGVICGFAIIMAGECDDLE